MKINIITLNDGYSLSADVTLILKMFQRFFKGRVRCELVNFYQYETQVADINIFIEKINNCLFKYAPVNIYIANHHRFCKVWKPYLENFDYIFVKNTHGKQQFKNLGVSTDKLINIGWSSIDKSVNTISETTKYYNKDYSNWFVPIGNSDHHNLETILKVWKEHPEFPKLELAIDNSIRHKIVKSNLPSNINLHPNKLKPEQLEELQNSCGVHLCLNETGSFSHNIQEAKSVKSVVISTNNTPNIYQLDDDICFFVETKQKKPLKTFLGSRYPINENSLVKTVQNVMNIIKEDEMAMEALGDKAYKNFLKDQSNFKRQFEEKFRRIFSDSQTKIKKGHNYIKGRKDRFADMNKDENLPFISIITPTYNHQNMFKLAFKNWEYMNYPRDKMEWIIIDDSDNDISNNTDANSESSEKTNTFENMKVKSIREQLPENLEENNIKYIKLDKRHTTGAKRNIGIQNSSNDIIVFMDDDDYYPVNSCKLRVLELLDSGKDCVCCTNLGFFDINKLISVMNASQFGLPMSKRVFVGSLCFYKKFWEKCGFSDKFIWEGIEFIEGREESIYEINFTGIMVGLFHNRNAKSDFRTDKEPNGCHFGWSDELFLFITSLDRELLKEEEEELKHIRKL